MMKRLFYLVVSCSLVLNLLHAQVGLKKVAQSTMNFLLVSISPHASALGEAYCALGTGAESILFNPAGISEAPSRFELQMYNTSWIGDIDYLGGSFVWNLKQYGALGLSLLSVDYGTIYGTSLLSEAEKDLYPLGYKDLGPVKNVGAFSGGVTYGRAVSTQFLIGGNMRLVSQNLGQSQLAGGWKNNTAVKLAFDAGVKYRTGFHSFRFGMAIRNFSSNIKREEVDEQLPLLFSMGAALDLLDIFAAHHSPDHTLTVAIDFLHLNNYSERVNLGLEYCLFNRIALRGGYQTNQDLASWSAGIGVHANLGQLPIKLDYSYSNFEIFDGVNRLAFGIAF